MDRSTDNMRPAVAAPTYVLTLYVVRVEAEDQQTVERFRKWFDDHALPVTISVVDVITDPAKAVQAKIFATPTLVRETPAPSLRVIGDLSDTQSVLRLLQIV